MHRDLKPQNILVKSSIDDSPKFMLKIADFGLARIMKSPGNVYTHDVMTLWYRAPEILLGISDYNSSVDIWSLGCIMFEISEVEPAFMAGSEAHVLIVIFSRMGTPSEDVWVNLQRLRNWHAYPDILEPYGKVSSKIDTQSNRMLKRLLAKEPSSRISTKGALRNAFWLKEH